MKTDWKRRLAPFGSLYLEMYALIAVMNDDELHKLINACGKVSQTNCGWHVFVIAPLIKTEAQQEIAHRASLREAHQEAATTDLCTS